MNKLTTDETFEIINNTFEYKDLSDLKSKLKHLEQIKDTLDINRDIIKDINSRRDNIAVSEVMSVLLNTYDENKLESDVEFLNYLYTPEDLYCSLTNMHKAVDFLLDNGYIKTSDDYMKFLELGKNERKIAYLDSFIKYKNQVIERLENKLKGETL